MQEIVKRLAGNALPVLLILTSLSCTAKTIRVQASPSLSQHSGVKTGAEQLDKYLPYLRNKRVAVLVNQTSMVGNVHLADTLLSSKVNLVKIFSPEHGFRGNADAGEHVGNEADLKTGLPIISLYGKNKKPSKEALQDIDVVIFDIQDVGARFFTYISTLHYLMEACAENNKEVLVLDRPNPHGGYIDGPVLDPKFKSFVGMHPIPIVHGLTIAELAGMINGEKWLDSGRVCKLKVIPCENYTHKTPYVLPVKPSPNLPDQQSVLLYPSICLFEGTTLSVGRGTLFPFQVVGGPDKHYGSFVFTPKSIEGMAKKPVLENVECYGIDLRKATVAKYIELKYLLEMYDRCSDKTKFFIPFFNTLAGTDVLQAQIREGKSEAEIRSSWKDSLEKYQASRKKYLLYQDF